MRTTATAAAVLLFCAAAGATPDYLPLQEGNQWVFSMSNGLQMTTRVVGFANVGAVRCAIVETTLGQQKSREYLAADTEGVKAYQRQIQGQDFHYDPPVLRIKLPYREGDSWTAVASPSGQPVTTTFQSIGKERIETPAGTFDCIKVYSIANGLPGQPSMVSITYYAEGIGPVRQIVYAGGQQMVATLASTNANAAQRPRTTAQPQVPEKVRCPRCGAPVDPGATSCPRCGQRIGGLPPEPEPNHPVTLAPAGPPSLEKYQSPDGKVLLYKPPGWNVVQGDMFGPGTYGVTILEPRDSAVLAFITFAVSPEVKDSVRLAARCIAVLRGTYPDLQATSIHSTPQRERTITDLTLTTKGEKGVGHGYFFHTKDTGSVYLLLTQAQKWNELRPMLTTIAANLAYAPQGIAAVQQQGQPSSARSASAGTGPASSLAALLQQAARQTPQQLVLQSATLTDESLSLQIPEGWALEGRRAQYAAIDNPQTRTHGVGSLWLTIIPAEISVPGVLSVPYQPPPQALKTILESGKSTRDVQIMEECPVAEAVPALAPLVQQIQDAGFQVDARLIHVRFRNVPTGMTCQGLFCVICSIQPGSPVWQVSLQGSWAPDSEFEQWLPLLLRLQRTAQVSEQWLGRQRQDQALRQQQLNHHLQQSIAASSRAFDDYGNTGHQNEQSRDYTGNLWSQTTLGQGVWVAQSEGAEVYRADSWGLPGPEGRLDSGACNMVSFTGKKSSQERNSALGDANPWTGGQLELVDTRAEYERYLANP